MMFMASSMASTPTLLLCSKPALYISLSSSSSSSSSSLTSQSKATRSFGLLCPFSPWSGLKHLGISVAPKALKLGKKNKRRCKGMVVHASLFGVGAPEVLVIGVVALLVFGPKGLAEVARNLGKTLREFQPTIRELQEVSREFKSTLEKEIGLDDIAAQNTYNPNRAMTTLTPTPTATTDDAQSVADPNGAPSETKAYTAEEYLKITEEQLKAVAAQQQSQSLTQGESEAEPQGQPQVPLKETAVAPAPPSQKPQTETRTSSGKDE